MIKPTIFLGFVLLAFVSFVVFEVENRVENMRSRLSALNEELLTNKESIHVLKAEWSYLNQPEKLKKMSERYTNMQAISSSQVEGMDDIPLSVKSVADAQDKAVFNNTSLSKKE